MIFVERDEFSLVAINMENNNVQYVPDSKLPYMEEIIPVNVDTEKDID